MMLDHLIDPDRLSAKEEWVEAQVEREYNDIERFVSRDLPIWFDSCVNWTEVEDRLREQFSQQWDEDEAERQISEWEDRS